MHLRVQYRAGCVAVGARRRNVDTAHHVASLELLQTHPGPLIVPTLVITEVVYLLGTRLGAEGSSATWPMVRSPSSRLQREIGCGSPTLLHGTETAAGVGVDSGLAAKLT